MLLNLSNHPSNTWSKQQKDAAILQFGGILDMPFPEIDPDASLEQVQQLARETFDSIMALQIPDLSIHLMGEFTFCFQAINLFANKGIFCFASTTKRSVAFNSDGSKTSIFEFRFFRPYF